MAQTDKLTHGQTDMPTLAVKSQTFKDTPEDPLRKEALRLLFISPFCRFLSLVAGTFTEEPTLR